jgi:hypothetical protein
MTTLLAQIAPQRSTQYAALASTLAPHELSLSPLGPRITNLEPITLAGQSYLRFTLEGEPDETDLYEMGALALTGPFFASFDEIGGIPGPFLRPLETRFAPAYPPELVEARRYRGKTNELFTHFLCNIARYSSRFAATPWADLRVFDPRSGGGTTLFTALVLGAEAAGVEQSREDAHGAAVYLRQFSQELRLRHTFKEERLRRLGMRWTITLGREMPRRCIFAHGDTRQSPALIPGFKPHLIVADLPYGIQHGTQGGDLQTLLTDALPVWESLLPAGGALALAWDAGRLDRAEMLALVQASSQLIPMVGGAYNALGHRVDRVIKARDVLVALRP